MIVLNDGLGGWVASLQHNGEYLPVKQEANARLIAAAPDLLAVLEEEVIDLANLASMADPQTTRQIMDKVYSIIKKAKDE